MDKKKSIIYYYCFVVLLFNLAVICEGTEVPEGNTIELSATASDNDCHYINGSPSNEPDSVGVFWSATHGSFPNGSSGLSVLWTAPRVSSNTEVTITATATDSGTHDHDESIEKKITITVIPGNIDKIQYNDSVNGWVDITGTLFVYLGDSVEFRAILDTDVATWPSGEPVWGGTSGASGTGETITVTFGSVSSSASDYKTVTAESVNIIIVDVIIKPIQTIVACLEGQNFAAGLTLGGLGDVVMAQTWWNTSDEYEDYIGKRFEEDADWTSPRADDWVESKIVYDSSGNPRNNIAIVGFSHGGDGARKVAIQLDDAGTPPDLLFLFDSIGKPWHVGPGGTESVPNAIGSVINIYQRQDPFWFPISFVLRGYSVSPGTNIDCGMSDYEEVWEPSQGYVFTDLTGNWQAHLKTMKVRSCTTTHTVITPEHSPHTTDIDSIARLNTAIAGVAP